MPNLSFNEGVSLTRPMPVTVENFLCMCHVTVGLMKNRFYMSCASFNGSFLLRAQY